VLTISLFGLELWEKKHLAQQDPLLLQFDGDEWVA